MRTIINITTAGVQNNAGTQCNWITTAVCNDGTVWFLRDNDTEWRQLPEIPQDRPPDKRTIKTILPGGLRLETQYEPTQHGVDATPDRHYALRILRAHLELQNCSVTADPPSPIADVMNYSCERRRVLLAHAVKVLEADNARQNPRLDGDLAAVDNAWKHLLAEISGKTPEASAPPPT